MSKKSLQESEIGPISPTSGCNSYMKTMKILRLKSAALLIVFLAMGFLQRATAQDFTFTIQPSSLTLVPGQSASFVIYLSPFDGFTNEVTLSATNLPADVTATFSPQTLTPPGTSLLTLEATTNTSSGSFTLGLTAVGGGITNTASSKVSVSFGLLPLCYGAFQGTVTDATTGNPVPYASVTAGEYRVTANASGQYLITNLSLSSEENLPEEYGITASQTNYWPLTDYAYAVCDATNIVNLQIVLEQEGSISGYLTNAVTGLPLTNVTVTALFGDYYPSYSAVTDTNGFYQFSSLPLETDNAPAYYEVETTPPGCWEIITNTTIHGNSNSVLNLAAIPICYATVTGSVVYASNGLPATNISVSVSTSATYYTATDTNGNYTFTNVELGTDNVQVNAYIAASLYGYYAVSTNVSLTNCGQLVTAGQLSLVLIPPPPPVTNNYGALTGHVYDVTTGLPITNASVDIYYVAYATTDTNGAYSMTNVLVGTGAVTNAEYYLVAQANNYFTSESNVIVNANQTTTQNLYLLRIAYGGVQGTVLNSATGLPVSGAFVTVGNAQVTTGANGQYASGPLQLNSGNVPTYEGITVTETGYWPSYTNTTITNGLTNTVNIEFIQVCTGATIVGNVVNALTQQPITNATITDYGQYPYLYVMTDTNGNFIMTNITVGNNNSPIQTTLTATAPGFNQQSKTVTIFCDAVISTTFGAPETVFGAIDGFVTNDLTGQPLTNVFIGSSFGEATATDTNGYYILNQAPLGANGSNRTWTVTAGPVTINAFSYPAQTKSVVVSSNTTNQLNFGFGLPPTELVVSATGPTSPVTVGSNLLYTITLTNSAANAANVVLSDTLPTNVTFLYASVTNNAGEAFGEPTWSNGVVTTTATNFSSDSTVVLLITVTPTAAGTLTNMATVTSSTPDVNPSGTNHTAIVVSTAVPGPLYADIGLTMTGAPNPVLVSNQLTYTLYVTNFGPADAPAVVLTDSLPANVTFYSASQGSYVTNNNTVQWNIGALSNQSSASATIVILPLMTGQVTNTATVSLTPTVPPVTDTNLANNTASNVTTVTAAVLTNVSLQYGPITFNPQTGLYQQTVQFNNLGGVTAAAVRVAVLDLSSAVVLYNATGSTNGVPYVEYDQPVVGGGNVVFLLEYYESTRQPFVSTNFVASVVAAVTVPTPTGTILQMDTNSPFLSQGQLTIEFASVPGHTYVVQYSSALGGPWLTATPPIVAKNTRTQWIDAGPPETQSPPGSPGQRFYRVVQTN
jgi:uncharacterized repeat protein (TIGR01451 family)